MRRGGLHHGLVRESRDLWPDYPSNGIRWKVTHLSPIDYATEFRVRTDWNLLENIGKCFFISSSKCLFVRSDWFAHMSAFARVGVLVPCVRSYQKTDSLHSETDRLDTLTKPKHADNLGTLTEVEILRSFRQANHPSGRQNRLSSHPHQIKACR